MQAISTVALLKELMTRGALQEQEGSSRSSYIHTVRIASTGLLFFYFSVPFSLVVLPYTRWYIRLYPTCIP